MPFLISVSHSLSFIRAFVRFCIDLFGSLLFQKLICKLFYDFLQAFVVAGK